MFHFYLPWKRWKTSGFDWQSSQFIGKADYLINFYMIERLGINPLVPGAH